MRCKPGDLAVIVKSFAGNEGRIVRCVRGVGEIPWVYPGGAARSLPTWEIDIPILGLDGRMNNRIPDFQLRPLRDNDGDDETLSWAGKPEKVSA